MFHNRNTNLFPTTNTKTILPTVYPMLNFYCRLIKFKNILLVHKRAYLFDAGPTLFSELS